VSYLNNYEEIAGDEIDSLNHQPSRAGSYVVLSKAGMINMQSDIRLYVKKDRLDCESKILLMKPFK
jgi:hypothetical protein